MKNADRQAGYERLNGSDRLTGPQSRRLTHKSRAKSAHVHLPKVPTPENKRGTRPRCLLCQPTGRTR